jgi:hypothetical protein
VFRKPFPWFGGGGDGGSGGSSGGGGGGSPLTLVILLYCVSKNYWVLLSLVFSTFPVFRGLINRVPPLHSVLCGS